MNTNNTVRDIVISQTQVMAMRQSGINKKQMAAHYGITVQEMHQVMVGFGIYKAKTDDTVQEYNIIPNYDFVNPLSNDVNDSTTLPPVPHDHMDAENTAEFQSETVGAQFQDEVYP